MIVEIVEELVCPTRALYVQLLDREILNTGLDTVWDNLRLYTIVLTWSQLPGLSLLACPIIAALT